MKFTFIVESDSENDGWTRHFKYVHAEELCDILTEVRDIVRTARKHGDFDWQDEKIALLFNQLEEALNRNCELKE